MSKKTFKRHVNLLLIREEGKRPYVPIEDFSTFMCDHKLHRRKKNFVVIDYSLLVQQKH